jgi:hypothetical protein
VEIAYPGGPAFDIQALFADGPGEPDAWWRSWFQSGLDGVMKFTPPPTRKYYIRLVVVTGLPPWVGFPNEVMSTSWVGDAAFENALSVDPSLAAAPDLISVNMVDLEPPRTAVRLLRFTAALRHELIHVTKHAASHADVLAIEAEGHAGQKDFIRRAAKSFGVTRKERDRLIEDNKAAEAARVADYRGNL